MAKCYISGAITDDPNYMEKFAKAQEYLETQGYEVINPALINSNLPKSTTWKEYMDISMRLIEMCDTAFFMRGWEKSCGANREYGWAIAKGLDMMYE